jgi:UDP-N-acetyl-D-galactosamine dehydrogenase
MLIGHERSVSAARILILGLTFKENCTDMRNTRVVDIVAELKEFGVQVDVYDPWVNPADAEAELGIRPLQQPQAGAYDAVVIAVAHRQFRDMGEAGIRALGKPDALLFDVKYLLPVDAVDGRL